MVSSYFPLGICHLNGLGRHLSTSRQNAFKVCHDDFLNVVHLFASVSVPDDPAVYSEYKSSGNTDPYADTHACSNRGDANGGGWVIHGTPPVHTKRPWRVTPATFSTTSRLVLLVASFGDTASHVRACRHSINRGVRDDDVTAEAAR